MRPLALLLPLLALAHAADANSILRRDKTIYARGESGHHDIEIKQFYIPDKQCSGVIEGKNLLCPNFYTQQPYPPMWMQVGTGLEHRAPNITIRDQLDRADIVRIEPCLGDLDIYLEKDCGY